MLEIKLMSHLRMLPSLFKIQTYLLFKHQNGLGLAAGGQSSASLVL